MTSLAGLRILITGGAKGIGAATAVLAAERGAAVVISDVDDTAGNATVDAITQAGGSAFYQHCDVADDDQLRELIETGAERLGGLDVLHNNAGISEHAIRPDPSFEGMDVEAFDQVYAINLRAPWLATKWALPYLKRSDHASVINCGSTRSYLGYPNSTAYGSTKAGLTVLTKSLAVALAPYGIRVNCYCPGGTRTTSMNERLADADDQKALERRIRQFNLVDRVGEADDIARLVCFLASQESSFVNGVSWLIDGGQLAWRSTIDQLGLD